MSLKDSSWGRLLSVLVSPGETFASIAARPTWIAPLLALVIATGISGYAVHLRTDYEGLAAAGAERRGVELDADQLEQAAAGQEKVTGFIAPVGGLFAAVFMLFFAAVYWGLLSFLGGTLTYKQSLSTYLYGIVPVILMSLLLVPVVLARERLTVDEMMTRNFMASNLAFLAPEGNTALEAALAGLDVFTLWTTVLLIIGYRIVAKVSWGISAGVSIALFLVGLALRVLFTVLGGAS